MSRLKQSQNIDRLIESIQSVLKNQCSLSDMDIKILNETIVSLESLRKKKGKTNEQILTETAKAIELLTKFFLRS
ncbi:MAG: hypothetical protein VYB44_06525 [Bacteroidota bacterium]|nr:hypothetical protein [Bacteroidota bacterium]